VVIGVLLVAGTVFVLWQTSQTLEDAGHAGISTVDVVLILVVDAVGVLLLWRLGGVRADPDHDGLRVRNVVRTRKVAWAEVVAVTLTPSNAWVFLDLADGTRLAVMAVQQADGGHGRAEAARLRALVDELGTATDPHAPDDADPQAPRDEPGDVG